MVTIAVLIYNLIIISGTAYLVALHGWSGWWFLLAILMLMGVKNKDEQ
jgi:hypothetical protein